MSEGKFQPIRLDIPPDLHPGTIRGETPGANTARGGVEAVYEALSKVNEVAAEIRDKGRLATVAADLCERTIRRAEAARDTVRKQQAEFERRIQQTIQTPPKNQNLASEIRGHWAERSAAKGKDGGNLKAFQSLLDLAGEDATSTAAILTAPPYLSGLTADQFQTLRQRAAERMCPDDVAALEQARDGETKLNRALDYLTENMAERINAWKDDDHARLEGLK